LQTQALDCVSSAPLPTMSLQILSTDLWLWERNNLTSCSRFPIKRIPDGNNLVPRRRQAVDGRGWWFFSTILVPFAWSISLSPSLRVCHIVCRFFYCQISFLSLDCAL
jgi:hypothetical protein